MADFFGFTLDGQGALRIVFNDTTNEFDGAGLFVTRQISGSTARGGSVSVKPAGNPVLDAAGDASWPHYAATGPGGAMPSSSWRR